jgi:uncharacterized coiled-coil protein SlyX
MKMPPQIQPHERQKVKFDATVNLGHILTFVGFLVAGFGAWSTMDKRVIVLEETRTYQKQIDAMQDGKLLESLAQMKDLMARLEKQVDRLADKQEKQGRDKP